MKSEHILDTSGRLFNDENIVILEHYRMQKSGRMKLIDIDRTHNGIVTVGKNSLFDVAFRAQTQLTAWYFGLIVNTGTPTLAAADTMSSHSGWTEFTDYTESNRVQWSPDAAASGSITNTTASTFNINATGSVYGMFLASNNTKSGTTGTLWATAAFSAPKSVVNTDQIKLTYTLNA